MAKSTADAEQNIAGNAPEALALSDADREKAMKDGAKDDVKEAAKNAHHALTDGSQPGAPPKNPYHGYDEIQQYAGFLDLGVDEFTKRVAVKASEESAIPDEKVYGLLALERNGKNRTPYVKAMMKRLSLKADELPGGGPSYTNDLTSITDL